MRVLGIGEKFEVWYEIESVTDIMENFGVKVDFFVGFEVRGSGMNENVDTGFLLFSVHSFVGGRGLAEKPLAIFRREFSHSLVYRGRLGSEFALAVWLNPKGRVFLAKDSLGKIVDVSGF